MRILLSPDSFKGCLSSVEVCSAISEGIKKANPDIEIMQYPSSDGGEGFCDCMKNIFGGSMIKKEVTYPMGDKGPAEFLFNEASKTAYIELASAAGLHLVPKDKRNIFEATTYGVGELICEAIELGLENIIIGIGGSATNDCGIGMLSAMGAVLVDQKGYYMVPCAEHMNDIKFIDTGNMIDTSNVRFIAACDVKNPLCGKNGAAAVFAKQKGANDIEAEWLDYAALSLSNAIGIDPFKEGYGAAGGVGMALMEFLNAQYVSGASLMVNSDSYQNALKSADLVITGEGNTDAQTVNGKLVSVVATEAKKNNKPVIVISGGLGDGYEVLYDIGVDKFCSLTEDIDDVEYCIAHAYELLSKKAEDLIRTIMK